MPYQPVEDIHDSPLTPGSSADLTSHNLLLIEKWELMYPKYAYKQILMSPTVAADNGETLTSGTTSGTVVDAVYGEVVPLHLTRGFVQPHGTKGGAPEVDATVSKRFKDPVLLPVYVDRDSTERPLTSRGQEALRYFKIIWPAALLDRYGVSVNAGDEFEYGSQEIEIQSVYVPPRGYWKTTNIPLYIQASGSLRVKGS